VSISWNSLPMAKGISIMLIRPRSLATEVRPPNSMSPLSRITSSTVRSDVSTMSQRVGPSAPGAAAAGSNGSRRAARARSPSLTGHSPSRPISGKLT
jgi:hypothetical protein